MYDFHNSTDIFVYPSFLPFFYSQEHTTEIALKTGTILVPKFAYVLCEFKTRPWHHIAIIHT